MAMDTDVFSQRVNEMMKLVFADGGKPRHLYISPVMESLTWGKTCNGKVTTMSKGKVIAERAVLYYTGGFDYLELHVDPFCPPEQIYVTANELGQEPPAEIVEMMRRVNEH